MQPAPLSSVTHSLQAEERPQRGKGGRDFGLPQEKETVKCERGGAQLAAAPRDRSAERKVWTTRGCPLLVTIVGAEDDGALH